MFEDVVTFYYILFGFWLGYIFAVVISMNWTIALADWIDEKIREFKEKKKEKKEQNKWEKNKEEYLKNVRRFSKRKRKNDYKV